MIGRRSARAGVVFALLTLGTATPAAAAKPVSEKVGERVSRGAIHESLEALDEPISHERMGRILSSAPMRGAIRDLAVSMVEGVIAGVREADLDWRPDGAAMARSLREGIDKQLTPALTRMTRRVVDAALTTSLSDAHLARFELLGERGSESISRGLARGLEHELGPALASAIDKDIGPAVAKALERDIMPAIGRGLETPEMERAVAKLSRTVAGQMFGGASDAMAARTSSPSAPSSGLQRLGDRIAISAAVALLLAIGFGTLLVVLVVLVVLLLRSARAQRRASAKAKQRDAVLLQLVDTLESDHPESEAELRRSLVSQLRGGL